MQNHGWRKPTPGLGVAEQLAQAGERCTVSRNKALLACKRVGAHIGLKPGDMMLLDTFGAFTQAQDWLEGRRPIVWASNAYLMDRTGFSLSALKRHVRRLVDAGVIAFRDSPNGKRWGHRDAEGHIIEAYGIDLSPLAARTAEFDALHAEITAERQLCARLKRQITIARRTIRAMIEDAFLPIKDGRAAELTARFDALLRQLPKRITSSGTLTDLLERFTSLKDRIAKILCASIADITVDKHVFSENERVRSATIMDPKGSGIEPHILSTNQSQSVTSMRRDMDNPRQQKFEHEQDRPKPAGHDFNLATIIQACPGFDQIALDLGGRIKDWVTLHRVAGQVGPMIGITAKAWSEAQDRMGCNLAAAALALIYEKFTTGKVISPGGYLNGMVAKFAVGELHLERSFFGRINTHRNTT